MELDEYDHLAAMGDYPPMLDKYLRVEEDFNYLVAQQLGKGAIDLDTADKAKANFHQYAEARRVKLGAPQTSPTFYQ